LKGGTYSITNRIGDIKSKIYANNTKKIETSINTFEKYIDLESLSEKLSAFEAEGMTPKMFQYNLVKGKHRKHIVLPEGNDDRILVTSRLLTMDVVDISIIGNKNKLKIKWQNSE
jgi:phosphate acetyltransferase